MIPDIVADVGNTRIKWGLCAEDRVKESAARAPDDPGAWANQLSLWLQTEASLRGQALTWAVGSVHPRRRDKLIEWIRERGDKVVAIEEWRQLPLEVRVDQPDKVGLDRLFNAVAANSRRSKDTPAIVADAGSAVTVDWVDDHGVFRGGAIYPGSRLMGHALHSYTARLPLVDDWPMLPIVPAPSTVPAIQAGVFWTVAGGLNALIDQLAKQSPREPEVFLCGGDASWVRGALNRRVILWKDMTLEGVRLTARHLPEISETPRA